MASDSPTPTDAAAASARRRAVAEWNEQVEVVCDVIRHARAAGVGVILRQSTVRNTITARTSTHVLPGRAAIFDDDAADPRPAFRNIKPIRRAS